MLVRLPFTMRPAVVPGVSKVLAPFVACSEVWFNLRRNVDTEDTYSVGACSCSDPTASWCACAQPMVRAKSCPLYGLQ